MRLRKILLNRKIHNAWKRMRRRKCVVLFTTLLLTLLIMLLMQTKTPAPATYCTPIDVVYTWVNGSDAAFVKAAQNFDPSYDPSRFDDKNELRYSLRSLELYAPWVRHVYIVTNGQIPYWLDLSYEHVTLVPHELLSPHSEFLPTFSSAAIETFLHNIPKLSKRFLYINDDIFLGAPLYPEDLYTDSEGVRIYQAWMVPDCAEDCPWTYIGDGACDRHCNIEECQHDGGDCAEKDNSQEQTETAAHEYDDIQQQKPVKETSEALDTKRFPRKLKKRKSKPPAKNSTSFKDIMRHRNLTTLEELNRIVNNYNNEHKEKVPTTSTPKKANNLFEAVQKPTYKSTKDIYSRSLIHTNMLLNRHYGFKARSVLAHVGFLLDRDIIDEMQQKFHAEVTATAAQRFRNSNDLQFAFAYYTFLMSEIRSASVSEIFDEFDTDSSQTWSDREVRTFLARMYPPPLDWSALRFFEEVVTNCSRDLGFDKRVDNMVYTTLVYERYEDSNLPTITRTLVEKCILLAEALEANFAVRQKYKYHLNSKRTTPSNFMMLTSNITEVVDGLDKIRRNPRKFNCINDNLEPQFKEDNELIRHLLEDFYLSFFPRRSKFELQPQYRNRFAHWVDYQRWRRRKRAVIVVGYGASAVLIVFLMRFLCMHKAKFVRRCVQKI